MEVLQNKKVLVIGATGGIGSELVRLLRNSQARIFLSGRHPDRLAQVASENRVPQEDTFLLDVTQPGQVEEVAQSIHSRVGALDILINTSGIGIIKPLESLTIEDFNQSIDVNLRGVFYLLKAFLPPMKEAKEGLLIHLPGVLGKSPMAGAAAYSASKYGLNGMLKSVREELKRTNVRITTVYMGGVDTPFWDNIDLKVSREKFITQKEAARAIWFLCQQPSSGVVSEMVIQPFNHQVL